MKRPANRKRKSSETGRGSNRIVRTVGPTRLRTAPERRARAATISPPATAETEDYIEADACTIRMVKAADIPQVIALDARITGLAKPDYWQEAFDRYSKHRQKERFFLVAASDTEDEQRRILGFIIGEIRAWEFGSAPCGWVFALSVQPDVRLLGVGQALFEAISNEFKKLGVTKMRTMVARDNQLHSLFFRGEGMMAGPYIQLEKDIG